MNGERNTRAASGACAAILAVAMACGREPQPPSTGALTSSEPPTPAAPLAGMEVRTLPLSSGAVVEDSLAGGEAHAYRLELAAGQYAGLVIDQRGIDVVVSLYDEADRLLTRVDSPNGTRGPEPLPLVADGGEILRLEVRSPSSRAPAGRYAVRVAELRPATARDRRRVAAERTFAAGEARRRRGDGASLRDAAGLYRQALAVFAELGERGRQADVNDRLGRVYLGLGEPAAAIEAYRRAIPVFRELDKKQESGSLLNGLGVAYRAVGEIEKAIEAYREALGTFRALGRRRAEAASLHNLGRAYAALGKMEDALEYYSQALAIKEELGEPGSQGLTLKSLAMVYAQLGEHERALEILARALSLLESDGLTREVALAYKDIGWVHGEAGRPREEISYLNRALPMLRAAGDRREVAGTLANLGWAYELDGRTDDEARKVYREALAIYRQIGDRFGEAAALSDLGRLQDKGGESAAALESYRLAIPLFAAVADPQGEAGALFGLARAQRKRDDLDAAQSTIERALERIEALRIEPLSQRLRSSFFATKQDYYDFDVDLMMERHRRQPEAGFDARALAAHERAQARSLLDLMTEAGADLRRRVEPALLDREAELKRRLNAAEERRLFLREAGATAERQAGAETELRRLLGEQERLQAEIRRAAPALTRGVPSSLQEIRREVLDGGTLLLEYALGKERSFLWAVTAESISSYELPPGPAIEAQAQRVHELLVESRRTLARASTDLALAELGRLLLGPVAARLAGRRLIVIPDGTLRYIPFGALAISAGRPLVSEHELVTLPSASTLVELRRAFEHRKPPPGTIAVLADPVFDAAAKLDRLPFSRSEAEAILALVPPDERLAALGYAASRAALSELGRYRIVHFATHGFFDAEHPELSGLALSSIDEEGRPVDGFLRAHEIYRLDLAADLVVLSACETALGRLVHGEGLVGLTRGFMVAGAPRVLVSLWQVEDRATAELMERFYREMLVQGRPAAAALRQAQLALWRSASWQAPYYWAGFVLYGDW